MASTMLTGDKRWAPTRKSGMTVLGKVPKPINLPSQRLENHGLDPNVEIVPKGTLTWGSRPTSAVPNVWASAASSSPNTDKNSGSPNHLNGRPSSGSGTRPSTAGSDKSHEPASNAWGPNLRPSSASGSFASNQTTVVAPRPRSAETRPSSAQLSRFAETPVESTVPWGPTRTAERVGSGSSKTNEFTLTSGDFPTLGSDKNSDSQIERGHSSHGRPGSSGKIATHKEVVKPLSTDCGNEDAYSDHGNGNSWNKDGYPCVGVPPPNTNWQRDPQKEHPYTSGNVLHQHHVPWHCAPILSSDGVWQRGGEVGGPYRPAGPPGGYPVEHYICYPQVLALGGPHRPSTDPLPKSGTGPGGYHPMIAESYHHHQLPDSYKVPSHPVRPGVYPTPMPYEGYYGPPPANFHNHSEFGIPVKEMSDQYGSYDPEKLHVIPDGHASGMAKEHNESVHTPETRPGQYRVLLKHHDCSEGKSDVQDKRDQSLLGTLPQPGRVLSGTANTEEDWRRNHRRNERGVYVNLQPAQEASSQRANDREGHSRDPIIPNLLVNPSRNTDNSLMMKPENTTFCPTKKNSSLIEKLSGLNNKARSADGHHGGDEKMKHFNSAIMTNKSTIGTSTVASFTDHVPASGGVPSVSDTGNGLTLSSSDENYLSRPAEALALADGKLSSVTAEKTQSQVHKRAHVMRGRTDDHTKLRSDSHNANEWIKKSSGNDVLLMVNIPNVGNVPGPPVFDSNASQDIADVAHPVATYFNSTTNVIGDKAQHDKLKEIAMKRAKELREEEEERIRQQRAKALAKLEELNRRTLAQCSNQKNEELLLINDVLHKQVEVPTMQQKEKVITKLEESTRTLVHSSNQNVLPKNASQHMHDFEAGMAAKKDMIILEAPCSIPAQSSSLLTQDPAIPNDLPLSVGSKNSAPEIVTQSTSSNHHESNVSKRKHTGSRRRPNISKEENISQKPTAISTDSLKNPVEVPTLTLSGDSLPEENSVHHKKRGNRNARNKSRMDETVMNSTLLTPASTKEDLDKGPTECNKEKYFLTSESNAIQDPTQTIREDVNQASVSSSKQGQSQATENVHAKVGSQWRPRSMKKSIKNQQVRPADKFHGSEAVVWAPVRPSGRNEPSGEARQKFTDTDNVTYGKIEHDENGMRTKRAEIERYVPKPVAKELSQHNSQESFRLVDPAASCDRTSKPDCGSNDFKDGGVNVSALGKLETVARIEFNKPNKHGKVHASWRQRNSAESPSIQNSTKHIEKTSDQTQATINVNLAESQHDDWNSNHDNLVPTEKITLPVVIKDQRVPDRQRHQQLVVHERRHHSPIDNKDLWSGPDDKICIESPVLELNESDRKNISRAKGQSVGREQMRSRWQPKSDAPSHNYLHEHEEDAGHCGALAPRTNVAEKKNPCLQEANRGIQVIVEQAKQQIRSGNCDLPIDDELAPSGLSAQHEQPVSSEPRRHGHYNNRFSRGHTSSRGKDLGQDAVKQFLDMNSDKRQGNTHLKYQPIVSNNKGDGPFRQSRMISEGAREGHQAPGPRYRERGKPQPKRAGGQFYGERSAATVQSGDSCNNRD